MPKLKIDGIEIEAKEGTTVLRAALDNGIFIPHFCWQTLLSISGNCRMCAVQVEGLPKLEMSCNLIAADGMIITTDTEEVRKTRRSVLEFLLINHPLDCPICDQAGECLLQDYHFKYSGAKSRFKEKKIKKSKAVNIGPHVKLDGERCILCSRCVRFCSEIAKESDLAIAERGDSSFITTAPGRRLDNPYSLNTVDLCPVGALTSSDFRFQKRVWFLKSSPSICPHCSTGCPIWIDHADGTIYRLRPRDDKTGNLFLCDEGRLSYKKWQSFKRIYFPKVKIWDDFKEMKTDETFTYIQSAVGGYAKSEIAGIISPRCSCEEIDAARSYFDVLFRSTIQETPFSEDTIIRRADKTPNNFYLDRLNIKPIPDNIKGSVLIVIDALSNDDLLKVTNLEWKGILQITHDDECVFPGADIVLPRATWAESDGTFINYSGKRQKFYKAMEPKGEVRGTEAWLRLIK